MLDLILNLGELILGIPDVFGNTLFLLILTFSVVSTLWFITLPLLGLCLYCSAFREANSNRIQHQSLVTRRILKLLYFVPFLITLIIAALGGNFWRNSSIPADYYCFLFCSSGYRAVQHLLAE